MLQKVLSRLLFHGLNFLSAVAHGQPKELAAFITLIAGKALRYRRKVVLANLHLCFPGREKQWYHATLNEFYNWLGWVFAETLWLNKATAKEVMARFNFTNAHLPHMLLEEGKAMVTLLGHYGNWEFILHACSLEFPERPILVAYTPLANPGGEDWFMAMRTRFGARPVPVAKTFRESLRLGGSHAICLVSDQRPIEGQGMAHSFFGVPTRFVEGGVTMAQKLRASLVYLDVHRSEKGVYNTFLHQYEGEMDTSLMMDWYVQRMERTITKSPGHYLWSHKRFKHDGVYS